MNDLSNNFGKVVQIKRGCKWQDFNTARLQISVGQEYHEGEKLDATLKWVSENFGKVIICVNDTLQRHNHNFLGADTMRSYEKAEEDGRQWIERNINTIRTHNIKHEIIRWEFWRGLDDNASNRKHIDDMYANSVEFKNSIESEIESFWSRLNRDGQFNEHDALRFSGHSREYLLEECAVFISMFKKDRAADIYPGSSLLPCAELKGMGEYGFTKISFKDRNPRIS